MPVFLEVVTGREAGKLAALAVGQHMNIGRTDKAQLSVNDPMLSNLHFVIDFDGVGCKLRDLGSKFGTLVNGTRVVEANLQTGDRILAGDTTFRVRIEPEGAPQAPANKVPRLPPEPPSALETTSGATRSLATEANGFVGVASKAAEVIPLCRLDKPAESSLIAGDTPKQFLERLLESQFYSDAIKFLAHALPKRAAVWWAGLCARSVLPSNAASALIEALDTADRWVNNPTEENRLAAWPACQRADLATPAGCVAAAAFWSGGSLGPAHVAPVPPPEYLTGRTIAMAIILATIQTEPEKGPEKARRFLMVGVEVATGRNQWKSAGRS